MRLQLFALVLALRTGLVIADEPAPQPAAPESAEETAERVLGAFTSGDETVLEALAARDDPDPWLVADQLCSRGAHEAADAFAQSAVRRDTARLPEYVASRLATRADTKARKILADVAEATSARRFEQAIAHSDAAAATADAIVAVRLACERGAALRAVNRPAESTESYLAAGAAAAELGWLSRASLAYYEAGAAAYTRSDYCGAIAAWERNLAIEESRANVPGVATVLGNLGIAHEASGDARKAVECLARALALASDSLDSSGMAYRLAHIGLLYDRLGDYRNALSCQQRALQLYREVEDRASVAATLINMGTCHERLGDYARALDCGERGLCEAEGIAHQQWTANALALLGVVHYEIGDDSKARLCQERALSLCEALSNRAGMSIALGNLGNICRSMGDSATARQFHEQSLELSEAIGDRAQSARTLGNLGNICFDLGDYKSAVVAQERALRLKELLLDREGIVATRINLGNAFRELGDCQAALSHQTRALAEAEELGVRSGAAFALWNLAATHLRAGDAASAAEAARRAISAVNQLTAGLAEGEGARARERFADIFDCGVEAGLSLADPAEVSFFLESGRASTLLELLGGRTALRAAVLPEDLRIAEASAEEEEALAFSAYQSMNRALRFAQRERALDKSELAALRAARARLDGAGEAVAQVIARIQRSAKAAASVAFPVADSLDTIRARLRERETHLIYGLGGKGAAALVVTRDKARIIPLGPAKAILDACGSEESPVAPALRRSLIDPLGLPDGGRVFVSPTGPLCRVPYGLLLDRHEVVHLPSGTTYGVLLDEAEKRGEGILALGDPRYDGLRVRLRGTRDEAREVGDVVLLSDEATLQGLRNALLTRSRWRAVHLACHGVLDLVRGGVSALALTPTGEDDGLLTVSDVLRLRCPADLVVLSACQTARGEVYRAEGTVGLARAFMFAGAPRVIVSLWKVDDEATRALMVKFYELWNPKDGSRGLACAAALKRAQEFVAGHEKWMHAKYWAAWQLWGLPD